MLFLYGNIHEKVYMNFLKDFIALNTIKLVIWRNHYMALSKPVGIGIQNSLLLSFV